MAERNVATPLTNIEIDNDSWVASIFMIPKNNPDWLEDELRRYQTTADTGMGDSSMGGSRVLNPPPGICEFADIPRGTDLSGKVGTGLGVYGTEAFDENLDIIHIRPGVPRYNSLTKFYSSAISSDMVRGNEYGWFDTLVGGLGKLVGTVVTIPLTLVMSPFNWVSKLISNDSANRHSYYYLAPAPLAFWNTLDNMVNNLAVRIGAVPGARYDGIGQDGKPISKTMDPEIGKELSKLMKGIYVDGAFGVARIDVLAISSRYTVINNRRKESIVKAMDSLNTTDGDSYFEQWSKFMEEVNPWKDDPSLSEESAVEDTHKALKGMASSMASNYTKIVKDDPEYVPPSTENGPVTIKPPTEEELKTTLTPETKDIAFTESFKAVVVGGADIFSLAVDHIGESKITISNSSGESAVAGAINGAAGAMRGKNFSVMGGNLGDDAISNLIEATASTASAAISGLTEGFVGGAATAIMGGKAFIDIPHVYQDSTMEFNKMDFSFTSVATSGHPISKIQMYLPYLALLALTAPRSAGPSSYGQPFLVEVHHKGKGMIELGLIDSLNATFGETDDWDINDIPNVLKVDFSVTNLSKGFHIPVDPDLNLTYTDTGAFELHMGVLAGVSLTEHDKSLMYGLKRNAIKFAQGIDKYTSSSYWGHRIGSVTRNTFEAPLNLFGAFIDRR